MTTKKERLDKLFNEIGKQTTDFRLAYTYGSKEEPKFSNWLPYFEAQQKKGFIEQVNQRTQLCNEIILDLDKGNYNALIEQLKKDGLKFEAYATDKGRCQQIHLFYEGLVTLDKLDREAIREIVIKKYGCDLAFKIDEHLTPLKYDGAKHWKTGQEIKLIEKVEGVNSIEKLKVEIEEIDNKKQLLEDLKIELMNPRVSQKKATELIVKVILSDKKIYAIRNDKSPEMWLYKDGIYVPEGVSYVQEYCREILTEEYTTQFINLVIAKVRADNYINQEDFFAEPPPSLIPVMNGILNLSNGELEEFNPKYHFFNKINAAYNPEAKCPIIEQFFKDVMPNKDDITVVQEWFGYCLYRDYKYHRLLVMEGKGRNGKGETLRLLKALLGIENCAEVSLTVLETEPFAKARLHKKMVNISGDIGNSAIKNINMINGLTGGDLQEANRKHLSTVKFTSYAKQTFGLNELPGVYANVDAFYDRLLLINYPVKFIDKDDIKQEDDTTLIKPKDVDITNKLQTTKELSGLLNWSLKGFQRLEKNKDFSYNKSTKEVKRLYTKKSNSFKSYVETELKFGGDGEIVKKDLRNKYVIWCRENGGLKVMGEKSVKNVMEQNGSTGERKSIDSKQEHIWTYVDYKINISEEEDV